MKNAARKTKSVSAEVAEEVAARCNATMERIMQLQDILNSLDALSDEDRKEAEELTSILLAGIGGIDPVLIIDTAFRYVEMRLEDIIATTTLAAGEAP